MKNPPSNPAFVLACHLARAILDTPNPNGISEYISLAPSPYKDILKALAFAPHAERGILFDNQTQAHPDFRDGVARARPGSNLSTLAQAAQPRPRYRVKSAGDALKPPPPILWTIENLIERGSLVFLYGNPGTKKTWVTIDMGLCIASGTPWLEYPTNAGAVLYLDEESGDARFHRRLHSALRGHGYTSISQPPPFYYVSLGLFDIGDTTDLALIEGMIVEYGAHLVFIDAFIDVLRGRDENSASEIQPLLQNLRKIASDNNCAIVVIHHSNKGGEYRGSSSIAGAVDIMLKVESKQGQDYIDFSADKARDSKVGSFSAVAIWGDQQGFYLKRVDGQHKAPEIPQAERHVIKYLYQHGASLIKDIKNSAEGCAPSTARNAVYTLQDRGLIESYKPKGQRAYLYELVEGWGNDNLALLATIQNEIAREERARKKAEERAHAESTQTLDPDQPNLSL